MKNYILETERFRLREFDKADAPFLVRLNDHPDIFKFTTDPPFESISEALEFIMNYDAYSKFGFGRWAIESMRDSQFIGWCGLKYILEENEIDVGYRLLPEYWGNGIATETAGACCEFGQNNLGLNRIVARVHKTNLRSVRVLEKINMIYERDLIYDGVPWLNYVYCGKKEMINKDLFKAFPAIKNKID